MSGEWRWLRGAARSVGKHLSDFIPCFPCLPWFNLRPESKARLSLPACLRFTPLPMKTRRVRTILRVMFLTLAVWARPARAADCAAVAVNALDQGWYDASGLHDPNNPNFLCGEAPSSVSPVRNWFAFNIPASTQQVVAASLRIFIALSTRTRLAGVARVCVTSWRSFASARFVNDLLGYTTREETSTPMWTRCRSRTD